MKGRKKISYNVVLIVLCFLMILFGMGLWGSKGLVVVPITTALNISRAAYSFTNTMRSLAAATANVFFGYLINKFGSKKLICAGFISFFLAAVLHAIAEHVVVFYLGGLLLGLGFSWTGTGTVAYVVNKICKKNKGTVMGFILAANGIGSAIAAQIITRFISDTSNPFGYRNAYLVIATIFAVMFFFLLFLYKEPKTSESDGDTVKQAKKTRGESWCGIEYTQALKKPYFYWVCACIFLTGSVLQGISGIYAARMSDMGVDVDYIAIVAMVASISLSVFKFLNGFMYDKLGLRITITIDCLAAIGVMACLFFVSNSAFGRILALTYAILAAIALPMETVIVPIYAKDLFGEKAFNKVLGVFLAINQAGFAFGGPVINACYDFFGSYDIALLLCAGIMLFVVITLQFIINASHRVRRQVEKELA